MPATAEVQVLDCSGGEDGLFAFELQIEIDVASQKIRLPDLETVGDEYPDLSVTYNTLVWTDDMIGWSATVDFGGGRQLLAGVVDRTSLRIEFVDLRLRRGDRASRTSVGRCVDTSVDEIEQSNRILTHEEIRLSLETLVYLTASMSLYGHEWESDELDRVLDALNDAKIRLQSSDYRGEERQLTEQEIETVIASEVSLMFDTDRNQWPSLTAQDIEYIGSVKWDLFWAGDIYDESYIVSSTDRLLKAVHDAKVVASSQSIDEPANFTERDIAAAMTAEIRRMIAE